MLLRNKNRRHDSPYISDFLNFSPNVTVDVLFRSKFKCIRYLFVIAKLQYSLMQCNIMTVDYFFVFSHCPVSCSKWEVLNFARNLNVTRSCNGRPILKEVNLYSAFIVVPHTQGAQVRITRFYLQITPYLPLPRKRSPDGAFPDWCCGHLIAAYYSFIYPERMKGWVGLVGWPTADGLPT